MSNTAARETITLVIGKSEALILFDFLADFHHESSLQVYDNAERLALVRLHGALESTLVEHSRRTTARLSLRLVTTSRDSGAIQALSRQNPD